MPIDFHDASNARTYASRRAHEDWFELMRSILNDRAADVVADVGCGGGIYSRAWRELGAREVIGLDSSTQMIEDARATTDDSSVQFHVASAYETGLDANSCDIVFSRAVIHHLDDHTAAITEAFRVIKPGGLVIVQDRSIEDVLQPASPQHFRAQFFSEFPRLLETERHRRPKTAAFSRVLDQVGFDAPKVQTFWETRRTYGNPEALRNDLLDRTGRSILHEISDSELQSLTETIVTASNGHFPLDERDSWTIWSATKPFDS